MDTALFHARLASWIQAPTVFRLLNACPGIAAEFTIASQPYASDTSAKEELLCFQQWLDKVQPSGKTVLTQHIFEFRQLVRSMEETMPTTITSTKHVELIITTDGLPSDERGFCNDEQAELFRKALKTLEKLKVNVQLVVRLNTTHSGIRKFYTDLKKYLRFRVVVMTAFLSEAQSVDKVNAWLTYSLSIQHMREFGAVPRCVDSISERQLLLYEMRDYLMLLFGYEGMPGVLDPTNEGWSRFIEISRHCLKVQKDQWDPLRNKLKPLLDVKGLSQVYGPSGCCNVV